MSIDISIFDDPTALHRNISVSEILPLLAQVKHWNHRLVYVLDHYYRHKLINAIAFGNNDERAVIELLDHIQHVINRYTNNMIVDGCNFYIASWLGYIRILETWLGISDGEKYYEHNN